MPLKKRHYAAALLIGLAAVFYLGPRPPPVVPILLHPVDLPGDLDAYLALRESHVHGLRPGLEAHIQWNDAKTKAPTPIALVYLHSYSGSPLELSPVLETAGQALHANVFFQRFAGHGLDTEAMKGARVTEWMEEANEAIEIGKRLGQKVVVVALSTGATLAVWLAVHQAPMAGLVILSPNFAPKDWRGSLLLWPWGDHIAQLANHGSRYREWKAENALQAARWTPRQPVESLQEMMSLVHYVDGLDFSQIHVPLLCLYTDADRTVSVDQIKRRFRDFGSPNKQLVAIPDARHHVMAGDAFSPETNQPIAERIVAFAREVTR